MKVRKNAVDKRLVVQVPDLVQKLSTWDLVKQAFRVFLDNKSKTKRPAANPNGLTPDPRSWPKVHHIALLINNELVDVMVVQPKFASVLLSQPSFLEVDENTHQNLVLGSKYIDGKFISSDSVHVHGGLDEN